MGFTPSPNITRGNTQSSGSSHQITGSLILSSSAATSTLTMLGVQTGSQAGPGSFLALDTSDEVILTTPPAGGGGGGLVTTYSNAGNDRILTSVNGSTINGEANFTFDGSTLTVTGDANISSGLTSSAGLNAGADIASANATLDISVLNTGAPTECEPCYSGIINLIMGDGQSGDDAVHFKTFGSASVANINSNGDFECNGSLYAGQDVDASLGTVTTTALSTDSIEAYEGSSDLSISSGEGYNLKLGSIQAATGITFYNKDNEDDIIGSILSSSGDPGIDLNLYTGSLLSEGVQLGKAFLGIGTSMPSYDEDSIHVKSTSGFPNITIEAVGAAKNPIYQLKTNTTADMVEIYIDNDGTNNPFYIRRGGSEPPSLAIFDDNNIRLGGTGSPSVQVSGTLEVSGTMDIYGPDGEGVGGPTIIARNTGSLPPAWEQPMSGALIVSDDIGTGGTGNNGAAVMYVHSQKNMATIAFKNEDTLVAGKQSNKNTAAATKGVYVGLQDTTLQLRNEIGEILLRADANNEIIIRSEGTTIGNHVSDAHQITGSLSINGAIVVTSSTQPQLTLGDTNMGGGMYPGKLQLNDGMSTTYPATIEVASNVLVLSSSQDIHYQATSATGHKFLNYGTEALRVTNLHVSSSLNISGSSFYGDGANLTNVTSTPSPGGSDTQIQYNNGGAMGGAASFKFNDSTGQINISGASSPAKLVVGDDSGMYYGQIQLATGMGGEMAGDEPSLIQATNNTGLILSGTNKIVHQTVNGSEFYKNGTKIVDIGVTADTLVATKLSSSFISNTYFSASIATPVNATCSVYNVFNYHLTANAEVTASSPVAGASYLFFFRQDGTGARTVDFSGFKWPGGTAPTLSTAASAVDIVSGISDGTYIYADTTKAFS